jgi:hypothetical protein
MRFSVLLDFPPGELVFYVPLELLGFRPRARVSLLPELFSVVRPGEMLTAPAPLFKLVTLVLARCAVPDEDCRGVGSLGDFPHFLEARSTKLTQSK